MGAGTARRHGRANDETCGPQPASLSASLFLPLVDFFPFFHDLFFLVTSIITHSISTAHSSVIQVVVGLEAVPRNLLFFHARVTSC